MIMDSDMHSGGKATATELAKCSVCGAKYGELLESDPDVDSTSKKPESSAKPETSSANPESTSDPEPSDGAPDKTWLIAVIAAAGVIIIVGAILAIKLSSKKK